MYIDKATVRSSSGRVHVRYLLRVSYRENGRVKKKQGYPFHSSYRNILWLTFSERGTSLA